MLLKHSKAIFGRLKGSDVFKCLLLFVLDGIEVFHIRTVTSFHLETFGSDGLDSEALLYIYMAVGGFLGFSMMLLVPTGCLMVVLQKREACLPLMEYKQRTDELAAHRQQYQRVFHGFCSPNKEF